MIGEESSPIRENITSYDFSSVMQKVFLMMTLGLAVTGITSFVVANSLTLLSFVASTWTIWLIAELVLVIILSLNITKMGTGTCILTFFIYSIVNGLTLSTIFLAYTASSIASTFFITAGMFGSAAVYGKVTKKDLTKLGSYLLMGLIGIIIAGIINIFIQNSMLNFITSIIGIIIFIGLTAYDVQKIRDYSETIGAGDPEKFTQVVTIGALNLYLDFINIFLKLLSIMGKRRN